MIHRLSGGSHIEMSLYYLRIQSESAISGCNIHWKCWFHNGDRWAMAQEFWPHVPNLEVLGGGTSHLFSSTPTKNGGKLLQFTNLDQSWNWMLLPNIRGPTLRASSPRLEATFFHLGPLIPVFKPAFQTCVAFYKSWLQPFIQYHECF